MGPVQPWIFLTLLLAIAPAGGGKEAAALLERVDEIAARVAEIRALPFKEPVKRAVKRRPEIEAALRAKILEDYTPEEIVQQTRALARWGLLAPETDLLKVYLDLLTEQVAGFYDPKVKTFFLADWIDPAMQEPIIAHELTHALQDQHFDLEKRIVRDRENDDRSLARMALVEGEGVAVMFDFLLTPIGMHFADLPNLTPLIEQQMGLAETTFQKLGGAPRIVREELLFPYTAGAGFVQAALQRGSWKRIDAIYEDLPLSTEQVLHPARYFEERDLPIELSLAPLEERFGAAFFRNVLGELGFRVLFEAYFERETAARLAEGWDGDRFLAWDVDGAVALASISAWDSLADAIEFFGAYRTLLPRKYSRLERVEEMPSRLVFARSLEGGKKEFTLLMRRGNIVLLLEGFPPPWWKRIEGMEITAAFSLHR
ncbi:MAG: hypothetical protein D6795_14535 [Deltaproteobacteria bacterium]|nr:MAG: hypothetical protein D6795_14535 [Deltaproteobacteria bacterium]